MLLTSVSIFIAFYVIGAYSTTDILRLTSKTSLSVSDHSCFCYSCRHPLSMKDQIPIFSYLLSKGRCRYCHTPIPPYEMALECYFTVCLSAIAVFSGFSTGGFISLLIFYEASKALCIIWLKPRASSFLKELCLSMLHNLAIFALLGILFFFRSVAA